MFYYVQSFTLIVVLFEEGFQDMVCRCSTARENLRYNEKMTDRWSIAYLLSAWSLGGFVLYQVRKILHVQSE